MPVFQIDHASGVRLIGAEMLFQSELGKVGEPSAITDLLAAVTEGQKLDRVLLLGPRASLLVQQLPATSDVDVVIRGLPDARAIAAERMMHRTLTVWCGGFDRYEPESRYDLIVLLDELNHLLTPDSLPFEQSELLPRVGSWLSEGGVLLAQVTNALSTESLISLKMEPPKLTNARLEYAEALAIDEPQEDLDAPPLPQEENDLWWRGATGFPQRPQFWFEVDRAARASKLIWQASYAAYPSHSLPALLVEHSDAAPLADAARAHAVRLQGELRHSSPYLQEPLSLVSNAISAGQLVSLAPSWVLLLRNGPATGEIPTMVVGDLGMAPRWRLPRVAVHDGDHYLWNTQTKHGSFTQSGKLRREASLVNSGESVADPLVLQLREALSRGNFDVIRRLIQRYAEWLATLEPQIGLFATPDNVSFTDGQFTLIDRSWSWDDDKLKTDVVVLYCLRHFALRALRAGIAHPWQPDSSPDQVAESLAAMAGRATSKRTLARVGRLDGKIEALLLDLPVEAHEDFISDSVADGQSSLSTIVGGGIGFRELAARTAQLSIALQTRAEQVEWLEIALRNTRFNLDKLAKELANVKSSLSFRVGRALTAPVRAPFNLLKTRAQNYLHALTRRKGK